MLPKRRVKKKGGDLSENEEPVEVELAMVAGGRSGSESSSGWGLWMGTKVPSK